MRADRDARRLAAARGEARWRAELAVSLFIVWIVALVALVLAITR